MSEDRDTMETPGPKLQSDSGSGAISGKAWSPKADPCTYPACEECGGCVCECDSPDLTPRLVEAVEGIEESLSGYMNIMANLLSAVDTTGKRIADALEKIAESLEKQEPYNILDSFTHEGDE